MGGRSAVYARTLAAPSHQISYFQASSTAGAGIWGRAGAAVTSSGNIIVETGDGAYDAKAGKLSDSIIELSGKDLKLVDYYTPANRAWISKKDLDMGNMSPVVFKFKSWELVAASGKEGVIFLLDVKSLGGENHRTPLFRSPLYTHEDVDFAAMASGARCRRGRMRTAHAGYTLRPGARPCPPRRSSPSNMV